MVSFTKRTHSLQGFELVSSDAMSLHAVNESSLLQKAGYRVTEQGFNVEIVCR